MNPLTDSDYDLIFESLSYTREKFANYSGYPDEDFRRTQIGRVDAAIEHLRELQQGSSSGEAAQKGSGPARNGIARAARLLADAERIANSITDRTTKASALAAVAAVLAATSS
jgi:hypothetical protein